MRLAMIQSKQNKLYDFANEELTITKEEASVLQKEMIDQNINMIEEIGSNQCDLIFTAEAINFCGPAAALDCGYEELLPEVNDDLFHRFGELAKKKKSYLVIGASNKRCENERWNFYNSTFIYGRDGNLITIYDKIHLAGTEQEILTPGTEYKTFDTEYGTIGVCICWDMQFPETCRELVLKGAELIICPTWGWESIYGHARAYENGIYVASAMGVPYRGGITGIRTPSEVISPLGDILVRGDRDNPGIIFCEFDPKDCRPHRTLRMNDRRPRTYRLITKE